MYQRNVSGTRGTVSQTYKDQLKYKEFYCDPDAKLYKARVVSFDKIYMSIKSAEHSFRTGIFAWSIHLISKKCLEKRDRKFSVLDFDLAGKTCIQVKNLFCDFKDKFGIEDFAFTQMYVVGQQEISFYCLKEKLLGLDVDSILVTLNFLQEKFAFYKNWSEFLFSKMSEVEN